MRIKMVYVALAAMGLALCASQPAGATSVFNQRGNILISDQFNNRVIEVDPVSKAVVWQFGNGSNVAGPNSVVAPNDAQRVGDLTLISGTGSPQGFDGCNTGPCFDNRVIVVNQAKKIVWQYGKAGVTGSGFNELNTPVQATFLPNKHILITDQGNDRVIEVTQGREIVWQYGMTGVTGTGFNQLNTPNSAELLENGDILIADESNNRVIEVNRKKQIVWSYNNPDTGLLSGAAFASRLCNGDTLITDSNNNRVVEVDSTGTIVGPVGGAPYSTGSGTFPTRAIRLCNGDTLISTQFGGQVIEIDSAGTTVNSFGTAGVNGPPPQLNAPYDAKEIGDYVGITPPFGDFFDWDRGWDSGGD